MTRAVDRFAPHLWVLSPDEPEAVSGNPEPQGPLIETLGNWIYGGELSEEQRTPQFEPS